MVGDRLEMVREFPPGDCWSSFGAAHKTVLLEEFDEGVPPLLRVFGASVDVDAPSTPFAFGPEIDGEERVKGDDGTRSHPLTRASSAWGLPAYIGSIQSRGKPVVV